jgi:hypothetical protein
MPAISLPLAQSKASRRSVGLWVIGRVSWTPSYFCDQTSICQPSRAKLQGSLYGRESSAPAGMIIPLMASISYPASQLPMKNDTSNLASPLAIVPQHSRWIEKERCLYGCDRTLVERGRAQRRRTCKWLL